MIAWTVNPCLVVVWLRSSIIVSRDVKGFARQLMEIKEKSLCSILFHLLVAGGRWVTVIVNPVSVANRCNSLFHNLFLTPFEPPPSLVMRSSVCLGYSFLPIVCHHLLIDSTAN